MKTIELFDKDYDFVAEVVVHVEYPDIILYEDKFYTHIIGDFPSKYTEALFVVADKPGESEGKCNIPNIGRKDKCLRCAADIDPKYGVRYCEKHQIGICFEHSTANCQNCGYNKREE